MRILHMIVSLGGGGAERQLAEIAPALARRGHDIHVAFIHEGVNLERLTGGQCTLHPVPKRSKYDPFLLPRLLRLARRIRPDVIHTWLTHMDIAGGATARLLRIPWVMSERSSALMYPPSLLNRMRVAAGRRAQLIIANSAGGALYWRERGVEESRIEIVPNFIPHDEIGSSPALDDRRIGADDELVLYVGRLSPEKNLPVLIAAMELVFRGRPRARLALCGEGLLRDALMAQVHDLGLDESVIFTGFAQNVASWLKRASVVVAISSFEGHPNAALEAIAAGVPIVVSDIPAYRAVVDDGSASFVPVGNARAVASSVSEILQNRPAALERAALAQRSLDHASVADVAERYEAAYRRAFE